MEGRCVLVGEELEDRQIEPDSVKVILDTALREYVDENDRAKQLDGKTTPMVAATGAVLLFIAGAVAKPPEALPDFWRGFYFAGICLALSTFAAAQCFFLLTLWGRPYKRMTLRQIVTTAWMSTDTPALQRELAEKYCELMGENTAITERKANLHKLGLTLLNIGLALLVVLLVISGAAFGVAK